MSSVADLPIDDRAEFAAYSDDDLIGHFKTFNQYDLDGTGSISPENLLNVLTAMEVKGASMEMVHNIIEEVAILSGIENEGQLSFRNYMLCMKFDSEAAAHNLALDAQDELRLSQREEEEEESLRQSTREDEEAENIPPTTPTAPPQPEPAALPEPELESEESEAPKQSRMRQSSMAALAAVASARLRAFQQVADEAMAREKLNAFKAKGVELTGPLVNSDELHKETLRNKVKAFETAARFKDRVELKKTWRQVGSTRNYSAGVKLAVGGKPTGPPPKKKITDLP